jgi:hypothetical protein
MHCCNVPLMNRWFNPNGVRPTPASSELQQVGTAGRSFPN